VGIFREIYIMTDRVCPMAFIVVAAFASSLIWVYALMIRLPMH
jgi:hypothetical protein